MSDNIKPVELSAEELDNVAGGAFSFVIADNYNALDQQAGQTVVGPNGGITSSTVQQTAISHQSLEEIKATGFLTPTLES
ncbi:MAG: CTB family bacteriocin [Nostoc sp. DedVER02]|uniref:CTB family bacteriocin n=1 Tax=unclassified Nostoc TaxID=2593658 RepID=UPI002AD38A2B|nr:MULTISPECIES: CTB family bacteriocin [unclassified Nostoc]MDZ7989865.1 CTB family bacteriocin [Nostoc sp. DedVER02]MDZ8111278.1 CTB family bacteriocin [Nostoc sp. DedVER01b]